MVGCSILGCKSRSERKIEGITFHSFPASDDTLKTLWVDVTGRQNWQPTKYSKICSIHFDVNSFEYKKKNVILKPNSAPVKHIFSKNPTQCGRDEGAKSFHDAVSVMPCTSTSHDHVQMSGTKRSNVLQEVQNIQNKRQHLLFRHGARTPVDTYKSDPYKNYQWPDGLGGLTNVGKLQLYELGKKFRSYYANFIPEEYFEKDMYIQSSDSSRCLMSAYTFLAGLYPPTERQLWLPELPWQPIPVHSLPRELDNIVAGTKPCKYHKEMYQEALREANSDPKFAELFDYLSKHTNQSMQSVLPVDFLYSTLSSEQEAGLKLPEWTRTVFPSKMKTPFMLSLALLTYNETMQRLKMGPMLKMVKRTLEDCVHRTNTDRSLLLFSGHDVTLVGLWRALGLLQLLAPGYGSSITLELHEDMEQNNFFVKVFYRNNTKVEVPTELQLPFCEQPCPYEHFTNYISKIIPDNWDAECKNT